MFGWLGSLNNHCFNKVRSLQFCWGLVTRNFETSKERDKIQRSCRWSCYDIDLHSNQGYFWQKWSTSVVDKIRVVADCFKVTEPNFLGWNCRIRPGSCKLHWLTFSETKLPNANFLVKEICYRCLLFLHVGLCSDLLRLRSILKFVALRQRDGRWRAINTLEPLKQSRC